MARFFLGVFIMAAIFSGLLLAIDHLGFMSPQGYDREPSPPVIERFEADPAESRPGESSILSWNVSGVGQAANVSIEPGIGPVAPEGEVCPPAPGDDDLQYLVPILREGPRLGQLPG
ncbi:MAG: hypothetical protein WCY97_04330 [Methanothrix sp.]|uniref:Uncharacterized protein n=1 Tax=Methanothrix harundinacea TaxID=301375 RepID=A0A117LG36_9EURY|nr:MAG: Uncharacterized protein XD72_0373 [Methanothrix harundinacea]MDD2638971.1 hypothetical protein [Methanothrix sp.]MDI9399750.1 hypothetical protein [Euryarchaeota archaeon]KUK97623.1 MAG: Uncharacterized protein XE07_0037 [Methanothrix harundinacea]MCP1391801.1 hypothetical protein [Methanothrix harundinacea]